MEAWVVSILIATSSLASALGVSAINAWRMGKKDTADAASMNVDSALEIVKTLERRVELLSTRMEIVEIENRELRVENREWQKRFRWLWDGTRENVSQLKELKQEPRFEPPPMEFRGTSVSWLDEEPTEDED